MPTNPTSLFDLHIDSNLKSLGGNSFLLFDTGPGIDRMIIFGIEENKIILSFASIWMADGTFKVIPSLFAQLYTVHALVGGVYPFRDGHLLPSIYIYYFQGRALYITEECGRLSDSCVLTLIHSAF